MSGMWGDAMTRRVINLIAAMSMVMCLGVCALWGRSYWKSEKWERGKYVGEKRELRMYALGSGRGQVQLEWWWFKFDGGMVGSVKDDTAQGLLYIVDMGVI